MYCLRSSYISILFLPIILLQTAVLNAQDISQQVLIHRTQFGVPHIEAKNIEAAGFALGYLQMQDYGKRVAFGLVKARGEWAKYHELKDKALKRQIDRDAA